jgi:hypothetical protein
MWDPAVDPAFGNTYYQAVSIRPGWGKVQQRSHTMYGFPSSVETQRNWVHLGRPRAFWPIARAANIVTVLG